MGEGANIKIKSKHKVDITQKGKEKRKSRGVTAAELWQHTIH
jgi:hypothetical protein